MGLLECLGETMAVHGRVKEASQGAAILPCIANIERANVGIDVLLILEVLH